MKRLYVDSSVIVALLFEEEGFRRYSDLIEKGETSYSSHLLEAEVFAAAVREGVPLKQAAEFVELISLIIPKRSLRLEYERLFEVGPLRGADACHIATALYLDPECKELGFVSADKDQSRLAQKLGFKIL